MGFGQVGKKSGSTGRHGRSRRARMISPRQTLQLLGPCVAALGTIHLVSTPARATSYSWGAGDVDGGNWTDHDSLTTLNGWGLSASYPNAAGDSANFTNPNIPSGGVTVTLAAGDITIGSMTFRDNGTSTDGPWNFVPLDGSSRLVFQAISGNASMSSTSNNQAANNLFSVPLLLNSNLNVSTAGLAPISVTGVISGVGSINKSGSSYLQLSNTNSYQGGTVITTGAVRVTGGNTALGTAGVTLFNGTELRLANINNIASGQIVTLTKEANYTSAKALSVSFDISQAQLTSILNSDANGTIALVTGGTATTQALDFATLGDGYMFLGASGSSGAGGDTALTSTYGATSLGAGALNTYRLGSGYGSLGTLVISNNVLAENSGTKLIIGQAVTNGGGIVQLNAASGITGTTSLDGGMLRLFGANGSLANSAVTANFGTTITLDSSTAAVSGTTRMSSLTLNKATLSLVGNSGANVVETITNGLTIGAGTSTISLTGQNTRNNLLNAASLTRKTGGTILFRGLNLGGGTLASPAASVTNIGFTSSGPTADLVGGGGVAGTVNISVLPYAIGGITSSSTGTSFVTYDANGIRPLNTTSEYTQSLADNDVLDQNINLASGTTTTLNTGASMNALLISGSGGIQGTGTVSVTGGAMFASTSSTIGTTTAPGTLALASNDGFIGSGSGTLSIGDAVSATGSVVTWGSGTVSYQNTINANGMTFNGSAILGGTTANTTGNVTVNGGTVTLSKPNVNAISGDVVINGGILTTGNNTNNTGQIADTSNVVINGGEWNALRGDAVANLTVTGGRLNFAAGTSGATLTITGTTNVLSRGIVTVDATNTTNVSMGNLVINGGTVVGATSSNPGGTGFTASSINITNKDYGPYSPIVFVAGAQSAEVTNFTLNGDITFNGDTGNINPNTTTLADTGPANKNALILGAGATHTVTVADALASVDLDIQPKITGTSKNLLKAGAGTLQLSGISTYSGATSVTAGRLLVTGSITSPTIVDAGVLGGTGNITGAVTVNGGTLNPGVSGIGTLGTANTVFANGSTLAIEVGAAGASDKLAVTGNLDLSSLLDTLTVTGASDGSTYTIATYTGTLTGVFDTAPTGTYTIDYGTGTNSAITITAVPEPSLVAVAGLMAGGLLARRRRRG